MKEQAICIKQSIVGHYYEENCIGWAEDERDGAEFSFIRGDDEPYHSLQIRGEVGQFEVGKTYLIDYHTEKETVRVKERDVLDKVEELP